MKSDSDFTARALLAMLDEVRKLENYAARVRIMVHAMATQHRLAIPLEPRSLSPSES